MPSTDSMLELGTGTRRSAATTSICRAAPDLTESTASFKAVVPARRELLQSTVTMSRRSPAAVATIAADGPSL